MSDTLEEARAVLIAVRRRLSPAERVQQVVALSEALRIRALDRLRSANPTLAEPDLVRLLVLERFGIALPPAPR